MDDDIHRRMERLYQYDAELGDAFARAMEYSHINRKTRLHRTLRFPDTCRLAGRMLSEEDGPEVVMLELNGWDTHNDQRRRLDRKFAELDGGLALLRQGAGGNWRNTLVIVATEFGRTLAMNGSGGSDHGVASAAFVIHGGGGQGQVMGDWPSLERHALYEGRDLRPTSSLFQVISARLRAHFGQPRNPL